MAKKRQAPSTTAEFEAAAKAASKSQKYVLRLYVAGITLRSSGGDPVDHLDLR